MGFGKKKTSPSALKKLHWWLLHNGPRRHVTVNSKNGTISFDSRDNCVGKHIFFQGEYDIDKVININKLLEENGYIDATSPGVVLNIGANIGLIATALQLYSKYDGVIAFEPVPANFELLKKNIMQNNMDSSVDCVNLALSSENGIIEMELSDDNYGDHRIRRTTRNGAYKENRRETLQVKMSRLDTFMNNYQKDLKLAAIFMDIQGHEYDFFLGAKDVIIKAQIPTVTEFWPYGLARAEVKKDEYCELISSMYTHYYETVDMARRKIDEIASLFDKYDNPDVGTDIILVNEKWKKKS